MSAKSPVIPTWLVERHALSELPVRLPPSTRERISDRVALEEARGKLEVSTRDFFNRYPPERIVPQIRSRFERTQPRRLPTRRVAQLSVGIAALSAAVVVALAVTRGGDDVVRVKGTGPALFIFRQRDGRASLLNERDRVRGGDVLQLSYVAAGKRYGAIVSIDGARQVTLHQPRDASQDVELGVSGEVFLPLGYRLDDAPGFERFFFVTSDTRFAVESVLTAARQAAQSVPLAGRLPLAGGFDQTSLMLQKDAP